MFTDIPEAEAMELQKKLAVLNQIMDQELQTIQKQQRQKAPYVQNGKSYLP